MSTTILVDHHQQLEQQQNEQTLSHRRRLVSRRVFRRAMLPLLAAVIYVASNMPRQRRRSFASTSTLLKNSPTRTLFQESVQNQSSPIDEGNVTENDDRAVVSKGAATLNPSVFMSKEHSFTRVNAADGNAPHNGYSAAAAAASGSSTGSTNNATQRHIISWNGVQAMDKFVDSIWSGNLFCETIQKARKNVPLSGAAATVLPITLNITFGCQDLFLHSRTGSGNYILALYMMRASAAILGHVNMHFTCHDAHSTQKQLILPWFTGSWSWDSPAHNNISVVARTKLIKQACCPFWCAALDQVRPDMLYDVRRMAMALVGDGPAHRTLSAPNNTSSFVPQLATSPPQATPLFNVELDDAVIHFRCGDLLGSNLTSYGFMTFSGYVRHISRETKSIGILTQPFADYTAMAQQRSLDADSVNNQRCKTLVLALKDYISERHPQATVSIRNDANETIALAYARIAMANQSIGARSTFSVFPIAASFGTGYYLRPKRWTPGSWLGRVSPGSLLDPLTWKPNVVLFDERNLLIGSNVTALWDSSGEEVVLNWFRS
jgi:hypothetical protein